VEIVVTARQMAKRRSALPENFSNRQKNFDFRILPLHRRKKTLKTGVFRGPANRHEPCNQICQVVENLTGREKMAKTFSQQTARAFEIAGYILMIPALLGVFSATLLIGSAPWFPLAIYLIFISGVVLLVGYFKHSRGRLNEKYFSALWLGTAIYNGLLLLTVLLIAFLSVKNLDSSDAVDDEFLMSFAFFLFSILAYTGAVVFSVRSFLFDKNQKYR
jgi:hypothetical protein